MSTGSSGSAAATIVLVHGCTRGFLLDRGLGAAGVALGTAAPKGVLKLP